MVGGEERALQQRLVEAGAQAPAGDAEATWRRTARRIRQRRRRRAAISAASLVLVALAGAAAVPPVWDELGDEGGEPQVVLEPAPSDVAEPEGPARIAGADTPVDAPRSAAVPVPRDWETVALGDALITVPPEWRQIHYESSAAHTDERVCPEGHAALVVAHEVRPAGCSPEDAAMPEGVIIAPATVAHDAVLTAADGQRVALPDAPARGRALAGSLLMSHSGASDRELLVLPGVDDGLVVEVEGSDGAVAALAAGEDLVRGDGTVDEGARTVRRVLATLRPREEPDREAIVLGRDEERLVSVHGDGSSRRWPEGPTPRRHAALADRATPSRPVAAVHGGRDPAEVAVLAGDGSGVSVVHRTASGGGDAEPGAVRSELVWAEDRPYVAWLRPAEDGVALRVLGWRGWDDLRAGDEPHTDGAVVLRGAPEPRSALAPVSWHEHGDGETTLELGRRDDPEGFGEAGRRGVGLRFDDEGALRVPDEAELRRLEP